MNYYNFTVKKLRKNRLNYIPFVLVAVFLVFIYVNFRISAFAGINNFEYSGVNEIEGLKIDVLAFQKEIKNFDEKSENYKIIKENLNMAEKRLKYLQQKVNAVENENWYEYYKNNLELTNITIEVVSENKEFYNDDLPEVLRIDKEYEKYMLNNNLSYDDRYKPSQGMSFVIKVMNDMMPIILAVLLVYITSSMYCSSFAENMNIQKLIPCSQVKKQGIRLLAGTTIGVLSIAFITLISGLSGAFGNALGNIQSPVLSYSLQGAENYIPFVSVLPKFLLLLLLSILFIVNLVSVISVFTRKNMKCMLISLVILVGGLAVITEIVPIQPILHILPITYINALKVVTGELSFVTFNANINFINGVIVLGLSNVVLFTIYYCITKMHGRVRAQ